MIFVESALGLNTRLADQQGVFMLPGIVSKTADAILGSLLDSEGILRIVELRLDAKEFAKVVGKLHRMNLAYSSVYADSTWSGRDLIMKIPALGIRTDRIARGEFS